MTDQKDLLFEKAPVPAAYFKLALPVVFGMVISLVYNMVDTYFIAQTHNTALIAGVSLSAPMFTFLIAMGDIFGLGGSSLLSRLLGQRKEADAKRLSAVCFYASLALGLVIAALMLLLTGWLTPLLPWCLAFAAGAMLYVVAEQLLPDVGDRRSLWGVAAFALGFVLMMSLDVALG